jgi:hypothetical protein
MISPEFVGEAVSSDRIGSHIRELEGGRHPETAPEALERAADYYAEVFAACDRLATCKRVKKIAIRHKEFPKTTTREIRGARWIR